MQQCKRGIQSNCMTCVSVTPYMYNKKDVGKSCSIDTALALSSLHPCWKYFCSCFATRGHVKSVQLASLARVRTEFIAVSAVLDNDHSSFDPTAVHECTECCILTESWTSVCGECRIPMPFCVHVKRVCMHAWAVCSMTVYEYTVVHVYTCETFLIRILCNRKCPEYCHEAQRYEECMYM